MDIVTVKMLATTRASADGVNLREYLSGKVYNLPAELATSLINRKLAVKTKHGDIPR